MVSTNERKPLTVDTFPSCWGKLSSSSRTAGHSLEKNYLLIKLVIVAKPPNANVSSDHYQVRMHTTIHPVNLRFHPGIWYCDFTLTLASKIDSIC